MEITSILLMLVVFLVLARIGSLVISRFGFPGLIGEILVGILIANIAIDGTTLLDLLDIDIGNEENFNYSVLYAFSELGVTFLLFSVGLETRVKDLLGSGKTAFLVALLGVVVPFAFGFAYLFVKGGEMEAALFLAAAMVATSVGITARVIKDMHLMNASESRIIIAAAVIDDVLGMIVLAIVQGIATSEGGLQIVDLLIVVVKAVAFVLAVIALAKFGVPRIARWWVNMNQKRGEKRFKAPEPLPLALIACFFFAWLAEELGLAAIIGSFLAGMLFADYAESSGLTHQIETITTLFISFFFVHVGLYVDVGALTSMEVIIDVVVILVLALISKYIGCGLGAKLGEKNLSKESFNIIGVGMIPRGEVGIIIAAIGLSAGILSNSLYATIVVMAVATTIIAPPILSSVFKRKYSHAAYEEEE